MRGQAQDGDARNVINARRAGNAEARAAAGYHPRRGGRYDSREDRSPTPEPLGTRVFSREIHTAIFPRRFRQPTFMAQQLSPGMPAGRSHHRRGHHPQPASTPHRLGADVA
jgi:hypothetical protein